METFLDFIAKQYGVAGFFAAALLCILAYPLFGIYKRWIESKIAKGDIDLIKSIALIKLEGLIKYTLPQLRINCPLRKAIFTKLIEIKLTIGIEKLKEIATADVNKMKQDEYITFVVHKVNEAFVLADKRALEAGVPEIALKKFKEFNMPNEDILHRVIDTISHSTTIFDSNKEKTLILFNLMVVIANTMLVAVEQTIDSLNGHLNDVEFNNIKCNHDCIDCKHHNYIAIK